MGRVGEANEVRILINGYFHGPNCPPFVHYLKKLNSDTKITNALGVLDDHGMNRDYLSPENILEVRFNLLEKVLVPLLRKIRVPFWKTILVRKAKKLVKIFCPDIIINHKASEKAEIMLRTGFRPQLTLIYGSEVHGARIQRRELDYIFAESTHVMMTTEQLVEHFKTERPELRDKLKVLPIGNFDLDLILRNRREKNRTDIRSRYGFSEHETIIFENRCLRSPQGGLDAILAALTLLAGRGLKLKIVFLRGFLGTDHMVRRLQHALRNNSQLAGQVALINKIIPGDQILDYYFLADAFVSLLPDDQCGKSISDALFSGCSLILSDLEVYRHRFGAGPCYIRNQDPEQLAAAFEQLVRGGEFKISGETYNHLLGISRTEEKFKEWMRFIGEIVKGKRNETSTA